jgi:hypothetical protein
MAEESPLSSEQEERGTDKRHPAPPPSREHRWLDATTMGGVVVGAVVGGLIVWLLVTAVPYLIAHVGVSVVWH